MQHQIAISKDFFFLFSAAILCFSSAACSKLAKKDEPKSGTVYKVKVQTAQAQQRHFRKQIRVQGTIQAYIFTNVAARAIGNMELKVDDGDAISVESTIVPFISRSPFS